MVGRAWARFSSCKPLDTNGGLNDIVLTVQYAENLENAPMVRAAGQQGRRRGRGPRLQENKDVGTVCWGRG